MHCTTFHFTAFSLPLHIGSLTRQLVRWFLRLHCGQNVVSKGLLALSCCFYLAKVTVKLLKQLRKNNKICPLHGFLYENMLITPEKNELSVSRSYRLAAIPCNSISLVLTSRTTCQLSLSLVVLWRGDNTATCVRGRHRLTRVQCELLGIFQPISLCFIKISRLICAYSTEVIREGASFV